MNKLKKTVKHILFILYGFFSAYCMPIFLTTAFNFSHGVGNNPDGELLVPVGIALIIAVLITDVLIIINIIRTVDNRKVKIALLVLFAAAKLIGTIIDPELRWKNFLLCFSMLLKH